VPIFPQFFNDWNKEWDVWRIVNIDPDSSWYIQSDGAIRAIRTDTVGHTRI